ncbi:MAG: hypothetical protein ACREIV_16915, partial [Planctomycetaceae bacterium]
YLVLAVLVLVTALAAVALRNVEWAVTELTTAQQALDDIIVTDGPTLDPAYVEAVDDLVDDPRALRDTHFDGLLHTIAMHNRIAAEAATVRTRRQMPRTSSLGVSLYAGLRSQGPDATRQDLVGAAALARNAVCRRAVGVE